MGVISAHESWNCGDTEPTDVWGVSGYVYMPEFARNDDKQCLVDPLKDLYFGP